MCTGRRVDSPTEEKNSGGATHRGGGSRGSMVHAAVSNRRGLQATSAGTQLRRPQRSPAAAKCECQRHLQWSSAAAAPALASPALHRPALGLDAPAVARRRRICARAPSPDLTPGSVGRPSSPTLTLATAAAGRSGGTRGGWGWRGGRDAGLTCRIAGVLYSAQNGGDGSRPLLYRA